MSDLQERLEKIEKENKQAKRMGFAKRCLAAIGFGWMVGGFLKPDLILCSVGATLFMFIYYKEDTVLSTMVNVPSPLRPEDE